MKISVVIPTYNEFENISKIFSVLSNILNNLCMNDYEVIFVDDGSTDSSLTEIKNLALKNSSLKYVSLSRNFGKDAAIAAGLEFSKGDYVIVADVDMQDPLNMIPEMYGMIVSSCYDCIGVRRISRKGEPLVRSYFARIFYKIAEKFFSVDILDGVRDFRIMNRNMVNSILKLNEKNRFSKGIFAWVGFKTKYLEYENIKRLNGETKWSFMSLLKYGIDAIWDFSSLPFFLVSSLGIIFFLLAFTFLLFMLIYNHYFGQKLLFTCLLLLFSAFFAAAQMFCFSIVIKYLSKTYIEAKSRPLYVVRERN
ncbi:MAG: glycosyltransferase family 2 protein [bacterium]|nr:glycosyltransferase family 2 protein [bacterium]